jgi:hypothetical protein
MSRNGEFEGPKARYRLKHKACNECRKRKLRCNGVRPTCETCQNNGRDCGWEDTLRKTGPRRGYVKSLETRLGKVLCSQVLSL